MLIKTKFEQAPSIKPMFNIGCLMDIPTGYYVQGRHGESLLVGGLGMLTGVVGIGNSFKSTIMHYMVLSAINKILPVHETSLTTYDTEINIHEERLKKFAERFENISSRDIFNSGVWTISDKTNYYANKWYEVLKDFLKEKRSHSKEYMLVSPFLDRDGITLIKMLLPTFSEIDSFSEFETEDIAKIQDDNELGDSGGLTIHMRQGLSKTRFLMDIPTLAGQSNHFFLLSAHIGKEMQIASGPFAPPPAKKLQTLKHGDKIKGVTDKFFFLMSNCWQSFNTSILVNQNTKGPEYPISSNEQQSGDNDLNVVSLRQLRSKSGPSGITLDIIVSQIEGVLPTLTEFHYIKSMDRFGIGGTLQNFNLDLYPEVKLTRPTVRSKIDSDPLLRRAINITSELCQIKNIWKNTDSSLICTPAELYNDLKNQGYDWNTLLNTRGYWMFNNDEQSVHYLSTMDLLNMRAGKYKPYWLK